MKVVTSWTEKVTIRDRQEKVTIESPIRHTPKTRESRYKLNRKEINAERLIVLFIELWGRTPRRKSKQTATTIFEQLTPPRRRAWFSCSSNAPSPILSSDLPILSSKSCKTKFSQRNNNLTNQWPVNQKTGKRRSDFVIRPRLGSGRWCRAEGNREMISARKGGEPLLHSDAGLSATSEPCLRFPFRFLFSSLPWFRFLYNFRLPRWCC